MEKTDEILKALRNNTIRLDRLERKMDQLLLSQSEWYDQAEVCQVLHISKRTLCYYREKGIVPYTRLGGKIYYRSSDIHRCLSEGLTASANGTGKATGHN